jgi:hypothetical protein
VVNDGEQADENETGMAENVGGRIGVKLQVDEGWVRVGVRFEKEGGDDGGDRVGEEGD